MESPEHADGQPLDPSAARLDPAAEPLGAGVLCYQCQYDLVGRVPGEPCPECGLDVAASWPAWDLRQCHPLYVWHVRGELLRIGAAAFIAGATLVWLAIAAFVFGGPWSGDMAFVLVLASGMLGLGFGLFFLPAVGFAEKRLRQHPNHRRTPGARLRRAMEWSMLIFGIGWLGFVTPGLIVGDAGSASGWALLAAGTVVIAVGLSVLFALALTYAGSMLERAGRRGGHGRGEAALGFGPVAGLVLLPLAVFGVISYWWVLSATLAGLAGAAGGLALRCLRARRVLKGFYAKAA
ncbi:hypothetical protein AY599_00030 [Leptolyngbya valderiana BDU 20041]|nr:hypothetical protein AY599_00030 [Leptolyngbya valderiana BDU 20041]